MRFRSLVFALALMLLAGAAFAQTESSTPAATTTTNQTICVPSSTTATNPADIETFNMNFVTSFYGICQNDVQNLRQKYDWATIYFIGNVASKTGRPVSEIVGLVDQGMSWSDIACRYNLTLADLRQPIPCPGSSSGMIAPVGAGPGAVGLPGPRTGTWISDAYGNVVLTEREDRRLKKMGYMWQDIAVAANLSMVSGTPVYEVLQWTDRGMTWNQVSREYGISPCGANILDISCYPFQKDNTFAAPACPIPCAAPEPAPCPAPAGTGAGPCPTVDNSCPETAPSTCPSAVPQSPCPPESNNCPNACPAPAPAPAPCPAPAPAPSCPAPCPAPGSSTSPNTPSTY